MRQISLDVARDNVRAMKFYTKRGFIATGSDALLVRMTQYFDSEEGHERQS
jgi:ribosomal protein S18 acetylase RimI-like enzyme